MPQVREGDGRKAALAPRHRNRSIRITIMTVFVGLLLLTAVPIVWYMHARNTDALLELADELMTHLSESIIAKTTNYLAPASVMAEMSAELAHSDRFSLTEETGLETTAIAILQAYPQLAMFNMGDEHGNFLMPKKMPDGSIATKIILRDADPPARIWKYRDLQGNVVRTETDSEIDYDPRQRPWYQGAREAHGHYWTDMYILFTDQVPGITTSYPIEDAQGRTVAVFGLDIELGSMSAFLETLKVGSNGVAFIFNEANEVVAYPETSQLVRAEGDALRPARIHEIGDLRVTQCMEAYQTSGASRFTFATPDGARYLGSVMDFPESFDKNWKIGLIVLQDDFIGTLRDTARRTLYIAVAILAASVFLARTLARSISRPITALASEAHEIQEFRLDQPIALDSSIREIQELRDALARMKLGLSAFRKYVPAELVQQLIHTGQAARLGGHEEELTVFFSDIAGFTSISETMSPETLMMHLSGYLDELTRVIQEERGTVDKYIGDSVMAFWGAPTHQTDHAFRACHAALRCKQRVHELNAQWLVEGKAQLPTRIGIHTGSVVVGNIGSRERMNYSVIGDAVNVASRLEGANKMYGTRIIVSQATREQVRGRFVFRPLDRVAVLGRKQGIMIYELMGAPEIELRPDAEQLCDGFSHALDAYFRRDWRRAVDRFTELIAAFPDDAPTVVFLDRCRALIAEPPGDDWTGITRLESK